MNLIGVARNSIKNMLANKLRTGLSSLGIIIGVSSVVVLLAIGEGASASILSKINSLGTNLLTIAPGAKNSGNVRAIGGNNRNVFTMEHSDLIASMSGVAGVAPIISGSKQVVYESANTNANIYGVTPSYETVKNITVDQGSFITNTNYKNRDKVAVLGSTVVSNLFSDGNAIGKTIRIGTYLFTVVGITATTGGQGDNIVYIPLSTAQITISGSPYLSSIYVSVTSSDLMSSVQSAIETTLNKALKKTVDTENYQIQNQADMLSTASSITDMLKAFLGGIAAISLIVGGIGVMNILLVTVSERTKEIGIRKAVGAKNYDIIKQFLVESIIMTVFGGIIGISLSYGVVMLVNKVASMSAVITTFHLVLALSFSIGIGLFFGIFPAYKAAKLKPIDALRSE